MSDVSKLVQQNVDMDMTPMIDCVFLLMIFFVLVIDLSQKNLEDLVLPRAVYIEPDDSPDKNRPIINVLQNGAIFANGQVAYDPVRDGKNYKPIRDLLLSLRSDGVAKGTLTLKDETIGGRVIKLIDEPILIRADKWTEWHYVGEIMKQCSMPDVAFWKVELALSEVDKEDPNSKKRPKK